MGMCRNRSTSSIRSTSPSHANLLADAAGIPEDGRPSSDDDLDIDARNVDEVRAFNNSAGRGRYIDAYIELQRLRAAGIEPSVVLNRVLVMRAEGFRAKYEYSLKCSRNQSRRSIPTRGTSRLRLNG